MSSNQRLRSFGQFSEHVVDKLIYGSQEIDCPAMELARDADDSPLVFSGSGYIKRDEAGRIAFKLYPSGIPRGFKYSDMFRSSTIAGKFIEDSQFYKLKLTDLFGNAWISHHILPDFNSGPGGFTVHGDINEFVTEEFVEYYQQIYQLRLVFTDDIEIPCNASTQTTIVRADEDAVLPSSALNLAKFSSCGLDFLARKESRELFVDVTSRDEFPPNTETRIIEALQFVLAKTLHCRVSEKISDGKCELRVRRERVTSATGRMHSPLGQNTVQAHAPLNCIWSMFDKYLSFIMAHDSPDWHPCSIHIHKAREAGANSLDAHALALTVSVEGLTNTLYGELGKPTAEFKAAVTALRQYVGQWPGIPDWDGDKSLRDRLPGLVNQLTSVRAIDRLYSLARMGLVEERLVDAWKRLRNPMAHAELAGGKDRQPFVDDLFATIVLMYHIIFSKIKYDGYYNDYSMHGFPVAEYPPVR